MSAESGGLKRLLHSVSTGVWSQNAKENQREKKMTKSIDFLNFGGCKADVAIDYSKNTASRSATF